MSSASPVVSVRMSANERKLLETAAEHSHTNLSDFVRRKALEAAEMDVLNQTVITISAGNWEKFEAWVKQPAKEIPQLRDLATYRPVWRE
jgi:uncharacterized protein (DUF1778 family)